MVPPSFARPTASSSLKASPSSPLRTKDPKTPTSTPKKLKRPSTLTPQHRQSITYKADLYPIIPQDATKPCPLATLPSELRTSIYQHFLEKTHTLTQPQFIIKKTGQIAYVHPSILHISRAIRIEAAYTYYTTTPFTFNVRNFDFSRIQSWLEKLPAQHRALLSFNHQLTVRIIPGLRHTYTYPPRNWLLDSWIEDHWKNCNPFGNIYAISSPLHRLRFILFCRLLGWFQLSATSNVAWRYLFDTNSHMSIWEKGSSAEVLWGFLRDQVGVLRMGCVGKNWTKGRNGKGKEEAKTFLRDVERAFGQLYGEDKDDLVEKWAREMEKLKGVVERW